LEITVGEEDAAPAVGRTFCSYAEVIRAANAVIEKSREILARCSEGKCDERPAPLRGPADPLGPTS